MLITNKEYNRFLQLREKLFKAIEKALEEDGHCKSYEGEFSIGINFPSYFEEDYTNIPTYEINLGLYLIAPNGRHHCWRGKTFAEALRKCEFDINDWIKSYFS